MKVPGKGTVVAITVTAADIEAGAPSECHNCPVALAIKRILNLRLVDVADDRILLWWAGVAAVKVKTPPLARYFIARFDAPSCSDPKPFTFQLLLPKTLKQLRRGL